MSEFVDRVTSGEYVARTRKVHELEAIATPDGRWWFIQIPELGRGAMGQARRRKDIQGAADEVAALWLDVDLNQVDVDVYIAPSTSGRRVVGAALLGLAVGMVFGRRFTR